MSNAGEIAGRRQVFGGWLKFARFALLHSLRDMWRSRGRTVFALICVATGVAAVVALRSLAFMIGDELTTSLAELNRGDIRIYATREVPELITLSAQNSPVFTEETTDLIRQWAARERVEVNMARLGGGAQVRVIDRGKARTARAVITMYVEPKTYPFYGSVRLDEPAGLGLGDVFPDRAASRPEVEFALARAGAVGAMIGLPDSGWSVYPLHLAAHPRPVVISRGLARQSGMGLAVGDVLRLGASEVLYQVKGIASADAETVLSNPIAAFVGTYLYLPMDDLRLHGEQAVPDQVFLKVPLGRDIEQTERRLIAFLQARTGAETDIAEKLSRDNVPELERQNAEIADVIDDMILVLGLSSLLIGGIGIVNTMLVVVSRRTLEIAVLKTLGLKGYRVTLLFLVEAALMGVIGSAVGIVLGVILSYFVRDVGEAAFHSLSLGWRIYPEAMLSGLFLGMIMTVLFGFLPTLIAGQVRPAIVLRPNEAQMPAAGLLQTLLTLIVMIVVLGLLVGTIIEEAISFPPEAMLAGAGGLVGMFAGVIIGNSGIGRPIPAHYRFRLPRRFDRLDSWLTGAAGALTAWLPGEQDPHERGRMVITAGLRGLRQVLLAYGALAIGAALASGILLVVSEVWLPFGIGTVKPANDIVAAARRSDAAWVVAWMGLTLGIGGLIRWLARSLAGMLAMVTLGATVGGAIGAGGGIALKQAIGGTEVWQTLAEKSTGIVLVEGAVLLLGAIYVGYWLLVWAMGKLPQAALRVLIGAMLLIAVGGGVAAVGLLGIGALVALTALAVVGLASLLWRGNAEMASLQTFGDAGSANSLDGRTRGDMVTLLFSVAAIAGGMAAYRAMGDVLVVGGIILAAWWIHLRRRYTTDTRLILREMAGRRGRVASTLLGLSVGVAGLALVSLTTGAVSHLLRIQLGESAEGNLLIADSTSQYGDEVLNVLAQSDGVTSFSQVTTYIGTLTRVNDRDVVRHHMHNQQGESGDASGDAGDSIGGGAMETSEIGIPLGITERESLVEMPEYTMVAGRALAPGDEGAALIMVRQSFVTEEFGIKPGDRLTFLFANVPGTEDDVVMQFRVVGVISRNSEKLGLEEFGNLSILPPGALPETVRPDGVATIAQVDESDPRNMDQVMVALADVPGVLALELGALTQLAENLLDQLRAIPNLVAWLALVAGTAIIANTVALATQERRRQIGVMKAVGLKGRRVLIMLMIENGLIGLIAGVIGAGVGFLVTVILVLATPGPGELKDTIDAATIGWLLVMSIVVATGAALFSAWSAAAEKPMNVLRYE